ncbi:hypothetical protein C478_07327 [Natrinema thermotolerans DSM 11552]|nr:hypothetical protein C478_07327 [Natrinema thermotolerans DSM 11552]
MPRAAAVFVAALLVLTAIAGGAGVAAAAPDNTTTTTPDENSTTTTPADGSDNETSTPATGNETNATNVTDDGTVIRLFPVSLGEDWLTVEQASETTYNTSGPFVVFETPDPVKHVSIRQPGASAEVVGDRSIRVEYQDDAAPPGKQSLYTMEIVLQNGKSGVVDLYAEKTSVTVSDGDMQQYRGIILRMLDDAESSGYERSPDGLQNRWDDLLNKEEVYESLFMEQAQRAVMWVVAGATNPVVIGGVLLFLITGSAWLLRKYGAMLRVLSEDPGRVRRMRREMNASYNEDQRTAADTKLREIDGIGLMGEVYWKDAYGVTTLVELAELFRGELPTQAQNGDIEKIGGTGGLEAATIEQSWLERVARPGRLPSVDIALSHGEKAMHRLMTEHGMGHIYRDTYDDIDRMLDELDESKQFGGLQGGGAGGAAVGGDD